MRRGLSGLVALGMICTTTVGFAAKRPNILFITLHDMRPDLAAYGNKHVITPNLDQLSSEGRLFKNHYVQVATCGPSRACLRTGKKPAFKKRDQPRSSCTHA